MKEKIAVQLYTLREECAKDFPTVLREISQIGYAGVQFAGFHGHDPKALKSILDETGMKAAGLHVSLSEVVEHTNELADAAEALGTIDVICPAIAHELRNEEGYKGVRAALNAAAGKLAERGIRVSYHNHAFEFETEVSGMDALAYLLEPVSDNDILAELDVYWLKKAGHDPVTYFEPYSGRMPIVHLKDMTDDEEGTYAPVGEGLLAFAPIIEWGENNGVEWYVVEQDVCKTDPIECITTSYNNLLALIEQRATPTQS
ncbi:sugar phosphate isomerase/epimerase family protein [Paenibacillus sp. strain BS8-2]